MTDIILSTQNGEPVASSRDVAKRFGKRHDHVIRDIEELIKGFPKNGDTPMFFKTEYSHPQNHQKYPMYLMNRDGFSMLAMGFTGKEAVQWKLKYIEAFNQMEKQLSGIPLDTLKGRLNAPEDKGRWKACEIVKLCKVLHIPQEQIGAYFFPAIAKEEKTA